MANKDHDLVRYSGRAWMQEQGMDPEVLPQELSIQQVLADYIFDQLPSQLQTDVLRSDLEISVSMLSDFVETELKSSGVFFVSLEAVREYFAGLLVFDLENALESGSENLAFEVASELGGLPQLFDLEFTADDLLAKIKKRLSQEGIQEVPEDLAEELEETAILFDSHKRERQETPANKKARFRRKLLEDLRSWLTIDFQSISLLLREPVRAASLLESIDLSIDDDVLHQLKLATTEDRGIPLDQDDDELR